MSYELKLDADGKAVIQDGKPVYVDGNGNELIFDVNQSQKKITELCQEAKKWRESKDALETKLKNFAGIDPGKAQAALEKVKTLEDKKLVDAGELERIKAEYQKVYDSKLAEANEAQEKLKQQLYDEKIGGSFANSLYIKEKLVIPADMARAFFGKHFSVNQDGEVVATGINGEEIYSPTRMGERASVDEALAILVSNYPQKDSILRGVQATGGGTSTQMSNNHNTPVSLSECKTDAEKIAYMKNKYGKE